MAKKAKYKPKVKKAVNGLNLSDSESQKLVSDNPQGDGAQGDQGMAGMMSKFKGMGGGKGNAMAGGLMAIGSNLAESDNIGKNGDVQRRADAAGDSADNPYKEGEGGKAALKGGAAGAKAGMEIAGPWGAVVGGVIGAGSGLVTGAANAKARKEYEKYNNDRLKSRVFAKQQQVDDPYQNLKYVKGTKYKNKPNQKLDEKAKSKANIEFEGGEPIFSPKKVDGTRDLLYFDKNGPKHTEGGIPAKVVAKSNYKKKAGAKEIQKPDASPVEVPEGSAIVTAKKNMGSVAVLAHKLGRHDIVEKIIDKMPEDKGQKKNEGGNFKLNPKTGKMETVYKTKSTTKPVDVKEVAKTAEAKKVNRTGTTNTHTETDSKNQHKYTLKNLSPEDAAEFQKHKSNFETHQKVLSDYRNKVGRDLNAADQKKAFDEYNKANKTNHSIEGYQGAFNGLDALAKKQGYDINLRGDTEGKGNGQDQLGIFGHRNAEAKFGYEETPAEDAANNETIPAKPAENKAVDSTINLKGPQSTAVDKPADKYKMRPNGTSLRASDLNNMYQGIRPPEVEHYDRIPTYNQSYYDLSDPARRQSTQAAKMQAQNAVNLSGGSAGNARSNMNAAYADNANRQQAINAFELGRFGEIKNANAQNKQNVAAQNTGISNEEKNVNAANRQATKDQFQTGLVGFDENNYRNKVTNDQYNVDMQKNDIENKKLNLLKNGYVRNYNFDEDYNVNPNQKKKGAKNLKYKKKKS